jgi:hypothetical protein
VDEKTMKQMAKMVDAVQPYCEERIVAAMTCNHAGSMSAVLLSKLPGGFLANSRTSDLPNPVFIAVGDRYIYAFKYAPKGWKFKIKQEVARWPKDQISVEAERGGAMAHFVMTTSAGESYSFEVPTMMGGGPVVDMFLQALGGVQG